VRAVSIVLGQDMEVQFIVNDSYVKFPAQPMIAPDALIGL
jgi:hypothetical protein